MRRSTASDGSNDEVGADNRPDEDDQRRGKGEAAECQLRTSLPGRRAPGPGAVGVPFLAWVETVAPKSTVPVRSAIVRGLRRPRCIRPLRQAGAPLTSARIEEKPCAHIDAHDPRLATESGTKLCTAYRVRRNRATAVP
jgi:hypothetical protein